MQMKEERNRENPEVLNEIVSVNSSWLIARATKLANVILQTKTFVAIKNTELKFQGEGIIANLFEKTFDTTAIMLNRRSYCTRLKD